MMNPGGQMHDSVDVAQRRRPVRLAIDPLNEHIVIAE
jgi:hypothetical protein